MTFKEKGNKVQYKQYDDSRRTLKRQIAFDRIIAEELNKIIEVVRFETGVRVSSTFIVDLAMRYFFEYLEHFDDSKALDIIINGVFLQVDDSDD